MIEVAELTVKLVGGVAPKSTAVAPGEVGAGDGDRWSRPPRVPVFGLIAVTVGLAR